ncbi:MAG: GGDEF domain-containing protein [Leptospiraceae bacterium]|nr:GGDEF domain-containing protein [Leptospiraceae bacterium]
MNLGFGLAVLIVVFFSAYAIYITDESDKARKWTTSTYETINKLKDFNSHIRELDIYKKEFLHEPTEDNLREYYKKLSTIIGLYNSIDLKKSVTSSDQELELRQLEELILNNFNCDEICLSEKKIKGEVIAREYQDNLRAEAIISLVQGSIDKLINLESVSLVSRLEREKFYARILSLIVMIGSPFTLLLFLVLILVINRDVNLRNQYVAELHEISLRDELTSLYNRRGFIQLGAEKLSNLVKNKTKVLLYFIDMDGLKKINDTHGHKVGDEALVSFSNIMKQCFRLSDVIARLGGDEFAVLVSGDSVSSEIIEKRIQKKIHEFNDTNASKFKLSVSIGLEEIDSDNLSSLEELLEKADKKMYERKKSRTA